MVLQNMGKLPQISEKVQVDCKWKLIGICNNPQVVPHHKLLTTVKHENKHVTGSPRGRNDTASLGKNCRGINNEVVPVTNVNKPTIDEEMQKSRQLLDALEILNSNSELFRKLLQDPNSLLMKRMRKKMDSQERTGKTACNGDSRIATKCRRPEPTVHKPLSERIKSKYPLKDDEILSSPPSVVVLKPKQKEYRRHKLEKHGETEPSCRAGIAATSGRIGNDVQSPTISSSNKRDLEAKRRLSRRLRNVEKSESLSAKQATTTLRRILSSPLSSPRHVLVTNSSPNMEMDQQMKNPRCSPHLFSESNSLQLENKDISTTTNYMKPDDSLRILGSTDGLSSDASVKNTKVNDVVQSIPINLLETPSQRTDVHITNAEESTNTTTTQNDNQNTKCTIEDLLFKNRTSKSSPDVSSPNPVSKYKVDTGESFTDTEDHLSPVSVLDSSFSEDVTSPSSKINQLDKPEVQPVLVEFEEESVAVDPINYKTNLCSCIRTLLQASELSWEELSKNARSSGQLLNLFSNDKKDLFTDFINDILLDVNENNVECIPWSSFNRPDTQAFSVLGKNVVEEVMKEVYWYLVPSVLPRTLEQLVGKDMEKPGYWSGTKLDTEDIVIQIVDHVLDESLMENIFVIME